MVYLFNVNIVMNNKGPNALHFTWQITLMQPQNIAFPINLGTLSTVTSESVFAFRQRDRVICTIFSTVLQVLKITCKNFLHLFGNLLGKVYFLCWNLLTSPQLNQIPSKYFGGWWISPKFWQLVPALLCLTKNTLTLRCRISYHEPNITTKYQAW